MKVWRTRVRPNSTSSSNALGHIALIEYDEVFAIRFSSQSSAEFIHNFTSIKSWLEIDWKLLAFFHFLLKIDYYQ